ncbi:MAG: response regulator transcription factor, partial [Thermomicrobiales bacterium]
GTALVLVALPYHADDLAWRRALATAAEAALRRAGDTAVGYHPGLVRVALDLIEGRWEPIVALAAQVEVSHLIMGSWMCAGFGECARARGDSEDARRWARVLAPGGPGAEPGGALFLPTVAGQRLAAALALDAGDLLTARAWLEAHDRWLAWSGAVLWRAEGQLGWAAYHRAAGDPAQAWQHAEAALAQATEPRQPLALLAAHRLLGELATVAGDHAAAQTHLSEALALADACAAPYERALCLLALAELRAATGSRDSAQAVLAEARAILEPLEAKPALARADAIGARLAAPAAAPPTAYPAGLSAREVEVLRLVAQGLTDGQVAERLFLSPRTVGTHLRAIYNKLGVDNRTAATAFAIEHGLR